MNLHAKHRKCEADSVIDPRMGRDIFSADGVDLCSPYDYKSKQVWG